MTVLNIQLPIAVARFSWSQMNQCLDKVQGNRGRIGLWATDCAQSEICSAEVKEIQGQGEQATQVSLKKEKV